MKITETRKAIIELIEPYMDKTLSEGCLIKNEWADYSKLNLENDISYKDGQIYYCSLPLLKNHGHYDITAVLKYINNNSNYVFQEKLDEYINYYNYLSLSYIKIPNKPLHLYTEEEDKQLLDLLLKLK